METSFVYIIKAMGSCMAGERISYFKIGVSMHPRKRMRDLQGAHYRRLKLLVQIPLRSDYAYELEGLIHESLRDNRASGGREWFYGTFDMILEGVELGVDTIKDRYGSVGM